VTPCSSPATCHDPQRTWRQRLRPHHTPLATRRPGGASSCFRLPTPSLSLVARPRRRRATSQLVTTDLLSTDTTDLRLALRFHHVHTARQRRLTDRTTCRTRCAYRAHPYPILP
jgi:hypothetical protein